MAKSQNNSAEWKELDKQVHILGKLIYIKFWEMQNNL